jgi:isocitrate dehydrogenase (NAD+)
MIHQATLIPGDGIGPEITRATLSAIDATGVRFNWDEQIGGVTALEQVGNPLPDQTVASIRQRKLALKGPLTTPVGVGFRSINVALRKEFQLYANVRPALTIFPGGRYEGVDIVLVRENLEGLYSGVEHFIQIDDDPRAVAVSEAILTRRGAERIIRFAFEYAVENERKTVTLVHKANILKMVGGLFLEVGRKVAEEFKGRVELADMIVDNAAMQLVMRPEQFDVIVTTNLFGDILSDEAAGLVGGLGLAPSANIAASSQTGHSCALFEPVHGSAPDIAGQGIANPVAAILAAAMLLDYLGEQERAADVRKAVEHVLERGPHTPDLGGSATTAQVLQVILSQITS